MRVIISDGVCAMGKRVEPWLYADGIELKLRGDAPPEIVELRKEYKKRLHEEFEAAEKAQYELWGKPLTLIDPAKEK